MGKKNEIDKMYSPIVIHEDSPKEIEKEVAYLREQYATPIYIDDDET